MNNVKSFPPEWNEFDSNNFGKYSVGGADPIIFTAFLDEGYLVLNDGKTSGDIGTAFGNNIGRVFIEENGVLYLVVANPATYHGKFAMSPEYTLTSYATPNDNAFNKIGI